MSNYEKTLLCAGAGCFGLFGLLYFVYLLIFEPTLPLLSFSLSVASLFLYVIAFLYVRYYFVHCCALCRKDIAEGEKRFVSKNDDGEIMAVCCGVCFKKKASEDRTFEGEDEREK